MNALIFDMKHLQDMTVILAKMKASLNEDYWFYYSATPGVYLQMLKKYYLKLFIPNKVVQ